MKHYFIIAVALFSATITAVNGNAQVNTTPEFAALKVTADDKEKTPVNTLVWAKFHKQFQAVTDDDWYTSDKGYTVRFNSEDVQHTVFLDRKGNYLNRQRFYREENLPSNVRRLVKSSFLDYTIRYVTEVNNKETTAYFVNLEDETSCKIVRVIDGELQIWNEYNKQKPEKK